VKSEVRSPKCEVLAIIALGSNLGDSSRIIPEAMERLQAFSDQPVRKSSLWRSVPVNCPPGSPDFLNAVVALAPRPDETPESLLARLRTLEREFGRTPKKALNEPRLLDLDLIAFGNEVRNTPVLRLPHPRATARRFVLAPLAQIMPGLILPGQSQPVAALLAALPPAECRRIAD
jgi:2-amino-4-hydroxy-6-hydroxymethyldihydropteridine diphosphokinase